MKTLKTVGPQYQLLEHTTSDLLPSGLFAVDHNPLDLAVQPVFNLPCCPLISPVFCQLVNKDVTGDSVERLTKVELSNIHSPHLIHQASHLIVDGCKVG